MEQENLFLIQVNVQPTPNPNAYKFVVNREVKARGKITYYAKEECKNNALAEALFLESEVAQLHFFENVITVTFKAGADLFNMEDRITSIIKERMINHDPDFSVPQSEETRRDNLPPHLKRIEEILDRTIRPALQADGGDLQVIELNGNTLRVQYMGACGSCPSSTMGTLMAIEGVLRDEYDPDIEVIPIDM